MVGGLPETLACGSTRSYSFSVHIRADPSTNIMHVATVLGMAADPG